MGRTDVPDLSTDYERAYGWKGKPSTRAKWRSGSSARRSVVENSLTLPTLSERRFNVKYEPCHQFPSCRPLVHNPSTVAMDRSSARLMGTSRYGEDAVQCGSQCYSGSPILRKAFLKRGSERIGAKVGLTLRKYPPAERSSRASSSRSSARLWSPSLI